MNRYRVTAIVCSLLWGSALKAQWSACGSGQCITSGSVGIGTPSPAFPLHIVGSTELSSASPGGQVNLEIRDAGNPKWAIYKPANNDLRIFDYTFGDAVTFQAGGKVGIGTTNPQHLLHVAGTIGAEEVLVTSTGADYVFDPTYRLKSLSEVASYIQANHHLPDIPSAEEVKQKGMGVGEMESKLLAKIEELTLHMIQMEEKNRSLEAEIRDVRQQNQGRERIGDAK